MITADNHHAILQILKATKFSGSIRFNATENCSEITLRHSTSAVNARAQYEKLGYAVGAITKSGLNNIFSVTAAPAPVVATQSAAPSSKHSEKGLKTLELMKTKPADWQFTPIKWVKEMREVLTEVYCPVCEGTTRVVFNADKTIKPRPVVPQCPTYTEKYSGMSNEQWLGALGEEYNADMAIYDAARKVQEAHDAAAAEQCGPRQWGMKSPGNCPKCIIVKGNRTGRALVMKLREVMVGYPQWPEGTRFDSRFGTGCSCGLCSKLILKSNLTPVMGRDVNGKWHGMWIGQDCAHKFWNIKPLKKDTHYTRAFEE